MEPWHHAFVWLMTQHNGHIVTAAADESGASVVAFCETCDTSRSFGSPDRLMAAFDRMAAHIQEGKGNG